MNFIANDNMRVLMKMETKKSAKHLTPEFLAILAKVQGKRPLIIKKKAA